MTDTLEILQKAQELIRDPENWTQETYAATKQDYPIGVLEVRACKFCAMGAIARIMRVDGLAAENSHVASFLDAAAKQIDEFASGAVDVNDEGDHADVMAMFDKAIALAKNEGE